MKKYTLVDKAFLLKKTHLFASLDLDELLPVADKLSQAEFLQGTKIFESGDIANRMYFIASGTIELQDADKTTVLSAIDFFGDEALFNNEPRAYSATSVTDALLFSISRTNIHAIISECPPVAIGLLQVYTTAMPSRPRKKEMS